MDQVAQHEAKGSANRDFADWVVSQRRDSWDWIATAYFYSALHLVDAYLLAYYGKHCKSHEDRMEGIRSAAPRFSREQRENYQALYNLAHRARYAELRMSQDEVSEAVAHFYAPLSQWLVGEIARYVARQSAR